MLSGGFMAFVLFKYENTEGTQNGEHLPFDEYNNDERVQCDYPRLMPVYILVHIPEKLCL